MEESETEAVEGKIEPLDPNLLGHQFCPSCGWIGQSQFKMRSGAKVIATTAALGGTGVAVAGAAGMATGTIVLLIGLAANVLGILCFSTLILAPFGILLEILGVICDVIGGIMLVAGGTAAGVGTTVAVGGGAMAGHAHHAAKAAAKAPTQCPECRNFGVIPAYSPVAIEQIRNSPMLTAKAEIITAQVTQLGIRPITPVVEIECCRCSKFTRSFSDEMGTCNLSKCVTNVKLSCDKFSV